MASQTLALHADWIVPIVPANVCLENHTLVIQGNIIKNILPTSDWNSIKPRNDVEELFLKDKILIPGLINSHTHAAMALFANCADDTSFQSWLFDHIWPLEKQLLCAEFVRDGSELAVAEMLLSGTTCFNDMYFFGEETARVCIEAGLRSTIGMTVINFPSNWGSSAEEYLRKGQAIHDKFKNHPLISTAFAPHAIYSVSNSILSKVAVLAEELDVQIHMHLNESTGEISNSIKETGKTPIQRLAELGILSDRLVAVHMVETSDQDIELINGKGVNIVHCPTSNLKLGCGIAPLAKFLNNNLNISIGTDGSASNNSLNMLSEVKLASLLAKGTAKDGRILNSFDALEMITINAAKSLGLDNQIGSLEKNKLADIVAIGTNGICSTPLFKPENQLISRGGQNKVTDVWVNGKRVVENEKILTLDVQNIIRKTKRWENSIKKLFELGFDKT
ncbi:MAG: TRZ/ATZ family hydrolase [Pseudomonadota bacterium]|nr:TRZ/ATZ family hydrolase [Pseudomonadota bacterium]